MFSHLGRLILILQKNCAAISSNLFCSLSAQNCARLAEPVPWTSWGPQKSRCFLEDLKTEPTFEVGGSRAIWAVTTYHPLTLMRMYDFNPSAVAHGFGKVVRKPKTFLKSMHGFKQDATTCLLCVVVVNNDCEFDIRILDDDILDEETMLILLRTQWRRWR